MRPKLREPQKVFAKIRELRDLNNGDLMTIEIKFDGLTVSSEIDHATSSPGNLFRKHYHLGHCKRVQTSDEKRAKRIKDHSDASGMQGKGGHYVRLVVTDELYQQLDVNRQNANKFWPARLKLKCESCNRCVPVQRLIGFMGEFWSSNL